MSNSLQPSGDKILKYWAEGLQESMRRTPDCPTSRALGVDVVEREQILSGRINSGSANHLATPMRPRKGSKSDKQDSEPSFPISVLVAPWVVQRNRKAASGLIEPEPIYWIPARLDAYGVLSPFENGLPFLARNLLSPSDRPEVEIIGMSAYKERFNAKELWKQGWAELLEHLRRDFRDITGIDPEDWIPEGYQAAAGVIRVQSEEQEEKFKLPLIRLCQTWAEDMPPIISTLMKGVDAPTDAAAPSDALRLGCLLEENPLTGQQASVARNVAIMFPGDILAVNGPPGSGKTSLLSGVIADEAVRALVEGKPAPVIAITSTNNQAVTNAVKALSAAPSGPGPESDRWLPRLRGYGMWVPGQTQLKKGGDNVKSYQIYSDIIANVFREGYADEATPIFLARYESWSGRRSSNLRDAVEHLKKDATLAADIVRDVATLFEALRKSTPTGTWSKLVARRNAQSKLLKACRAKLDALKLSIAADEAKCDAHRRSLLAIEASAKAAYGSGSIAEKVMSFLPSVKGSVLERVKAAILSSGYDLPNMDGFSTPQSLLDALGRIIRNDIDDFREKAVGLAARNREKLAARIAAMEKSAACVSDRKTSAEHAAAELSAKSNVLMEDLLSGNGDLNISKWLDLVLRRRAFDLTMRCREGQFLLNAKESGLHDKRYWPQNFGRGSRRKGEQFFRELALIMPVIAGTVYMIAKTFDWYDRNKKDSDTSTPLGGFVDLMIVDEAGQVSPELGGPVIGLASRALVVGDIHQLEPVADLPDSISMKLAADAGMDDDSADFCFSKGFGIHDGSVMKMAQFATTASEEGVPEPGILLRDHFRCVRTVISFCNDLVYRGRLIPIIKDDEDPYLPPFAHAHVRSQPVRSGKSWSNPTEADAIARWVASAAPKLIQAYGKPGDEIGHIVAVVTPFGAQKDALNAALARHLPPPMAAKITVGTVHALQGAERPIVLFSPTVTSAAAQGTPFFDRAPNMLSVAVSRAKKSFIVVGDLSLFRQENGSAPSAVLAKWLFADEKAELPGFEHQFNRLPEQERQRLNDWQEHDKVMEEALSGAKERVLISSLHAGLEPVRQAGLITMIQKAAARGVEIRVFVGCAPYLSSERRAEVEKAADRIAEAGAKVSLHHGVHTKTLLMDQSLIVEGSYNWLQAYRSRSGLKEASIALRGSTAATFTDQAWDEFAVLRR